MWWKQPTAKALLATIIWAASFVVLKRVLEETDPMALMAVRFGAAGIMFWVFLWLTRRTATVDRQSWWGLAALGGLGIVLGQALQAFGLRLTTANNTVWLVATMPVFTAVLARWFLKESFTWQKALGLLAAMAGVALVAGRGMMSAAAFALPGTEGDVLALASALVWAGFVVGSKPVLDKVDPLVASAYMVTWAGLVFLPFAFKAGAMAGFASLSLRGWAEVAFLTLGCSLFSYIYWNEAVAAMPASHVAAYSFLEPPLSMLLAWWVFGERLTPTLAAGAALIVAGVVMVNQERSLIVEPV